MEIGNSVRTGRCGREESGTTYGTLLSNKVADYVESELCDGLQPCRTVPATSLADSGTSAPQTAEMTIERLTGVRPGPICKDCGGYTSSMPHLLTCAAGIQGRSFTPRERYLNTFKELIDEMYALTQRKNADYAGEKDPFKNFREFGTTGFLVRMSDKWSRIRNLLSSGKAPAVKDEKVEDTLLDLATYSILLICWLREGN